MGTKDELKTVYTYGNERLSIQKFNPSTDTSNAVTNNKKTDYYLYDGRGSVAQVTSSKAMVEESYRYDPYGNMIDGAPHKQLTYGYNAEEYNPATGMQYLRARFYEVSTGRFISQDTYLGDISAPLTLNRYAYTSNNPVNFVDPSGNWPDFLDKLASDFKKNVVDPAAAWVETNIVKPVVNVAKAAYTTYVQPAIQSFVQNTVQPKVNYFKDNVNNYIQQATTIGNNAAKQITNTVSEIQKQVPKVYDNIKKNVSPYINSIAEAIRQEAKRLACESNIWASNTASAAKAAGNFVVNQIEKNFHATSNFGKEIIGSELVQSIKKVNDGLGNIEKTVASVVTGKTTVKAAKETISNICKPAVDAIKTTVNKAIADREYACSGPINYASTYLGLSVEVVEAIAYKPITSIMGMAERSYNETNTVDTFSNGLYDYMDQQLFNMVPGIDQKAYYNGKPYGDVVVAAAAAGDLGIYSFNKISAMKSVASTMDAPMVAPEAGVVPKGGADLKPYSNIPDGPKVGEGKSFTQAQKNKIIAQNIADNGGAVKSDLSGETLVKPPKSTSGVTPNPLEWQIDHIDPKSKGGSNSYSNAQVLSRIENCLKSDK